MIKLERPLVIFDLETTGLDVNKDRIVQFAAIKLRSFDCDGLIKKVEFVVNPGIPIAKEAAEVHGYTDANVKNKPPLSKFKRGLVKLFKDADWCGYNCNSFDIPMLINEFKRIGHTIDELPSIIDVFQIFKAEFPHTLEGALKFYVDEEHSNAHDAMADIKATYKVLRAQSAFFDKPLTANEVQAKYRDPDAVDLAGKLKRIDGQLVFAFGKHKGESVFENQGYLNWCRREGVLGFDAWQAIEEGDV